MSRDEKIRKLASAVRRWRGVKHPGTGQWVQPPSEKAVFRVAKWLARLGRADVDGDIKTIGDFQTYQQFNAWLGTLAPPQGG